MASRCLLSGAFAACWAVSSSERPFRKFGIQQSNTKLTPQSFAELAFNLSVIEGHVSKSDHPKQGPSRQKAFRKPCPYCYRPDKSCPSYGKEGVWCASCAQSINGENIWGAVYAYYTSIISVNPKPKPFTDPAYRPRECNAIIPCETLREGIGRRGGLGLWSVALLTPLGTALLIISITSMKARTDGKLDVHMKKAFVGVLACITLATVLGCYAFQPDETTSNDWYMIAFCHACLALSIIGVCFSIDVEFRRPYPFSSIYLNAVSIVWAALLMTIPWLLRLRKPPAHNFWAYRFYVLLLRQIRFVIIPFVPQNTAFMFYLCVFTKNYLNAFYYWFDTTGVALFTSDVHGFTDKCVELIFAILIFNIPYARDRRFMAALGAAISKSLETGRTYHCFLPHPIAHLISDDLDRVVELVAFLFVCGMTMRYQIVLPPAVQKIRFLRLGHMRSVLNDGRLVARCQEQPETAFGNPAKVMHLIIISHHWLDGVTCDVATADYPHGMRLTTMLQRFEQFYPSKWPGTSALYRPMSTFMEAIASAAHSNYDVLIFWDYPCMPQIGKAPDGTLIQRTEEELAIFREVLPACGLLYTMFPVMICPEVTDDVSPYSASGWCYCEQEQAQLCGTLLPYSSEFHSSDQSAFSVEAIESGLTEKQFRTEEDRDVVRSIVMGTFLRRELHAQVIAQDAALVQIRLKELTEHNLKHTIDYPVDSETLDALLHVAFKTPSVEIRELLIEYGADPLRPNHRGEMPGQFLFFPRSCFPCL